MAHTSDFRVDEDHPSIGELWFNIQNFAQHHVNDNERCTEYPTELRIIQMAALKAMVKTIDDTHNAMLT